MSRWLLSVDLEDWFHAHNLRSALSRDRWDEYELRVVDNTRRLLDVFDAHDATATFFVLGYVADRAPELVREIDERGHEIASHGYDHEPLTELTPAEFRTDLRRSVRSLETVTDQSIDGYRAPSFSITDWALEVLADEGLAYDSSYFPFRSHPRYGSVDVEGEGTFVETDAGITEIQLPLLSVLGREVPWAGGGYFRFIPYPIYRRGVDRIGAERPFVFYLHPWEVDPDQPRLTGPVFTDRLRHYRNLDTTIDRLERLLDAHDWGPIGASV